MLSVSSADENEKSTWYWLVIGRLTCVSMVFCRLSVLPILAPVWAKLSSYCLFTAPIILHLWCNIASALAVIILMVRSVFVAATSASHGNGMRGGAALDAQTPVQTAAAMRSRAGQAGDARRAVVTGSATLSGYARRAVD